MLNSILEEGLLALAYVAIFLGGVGFGFLVVAVFR